MLVIFNRIIHSIWYYKLIKEYLKLFLWYQFDTKSIILTATTMMTILTLILLNLSIDGFSQTLQTPDFLSNPNIDKSELKDNTQA